MMPREICPLPPSVNYEAHCLLVQQWTRDYRLRPECQVPPPGFVMRCVPSTMALLCLSIGVEWLAGNVALEIGIGQGYLAYCLYKYGAKVRGVDLNQPIIDSVASTAFGGHLELSVDDYEDGAFNYMCFGNRLPTVVTMLIGSLGLVEKLVYDFVTHKHMEVICFMKPCSGYQPDLGKRVSALVDRYHWGFEEHPLYLSGSRAKRWAVIIHRTKRKVSS